MKVCPDCGYKIDFGSAKFCHNCGNHLKEVDTSTVRQIGSEKISKLTSSNALFQHIVNENKNIKVEDKQEENEDLSSIYDLGVNLEEVVEQILKKRGFSTKRRLKLRGRSNSLSEIDTQNKTSSLNSTPPNHEPKTPKPDDPIGDLNGNSIDDKVPTPNFKRNK